MALVVTRAPSASLLSDLKRTGAEMFHEVWNGVHHIHTAAPPARYGALAGEVLWALRAPASAAGFTLLGRCAMGTDDDCRSSAAAMIRDRAGDGYLDSAELVVEVASPGDDSWRKFDFYAAHGVDEVLIADPDAASLHWFRLIDGAYVGVERSELLDVAVDEVHAAIDWELG